MYVKNGECNSLLKNFSGEQFSFWLLLPDTAQTSTGNTCSSMKYRNCWLKPSHQYRQKVHFTALEEEQIIFPGPSLTVFPSYLFHPGSPTINCALPGQKKAPSPVPSFPPLGAVSPGDLQTAGPEEAFFHKLGGLAPDKLLSYIFSSK